MDFSSISSYGDDSEGVVRITKDLEENIAGKDALVIEDIVDTGFTLKYLLRTLGGRNPKSIEVCTLLDRRARRIIDIDLKYIGFEIPISSLSGMAWITVSDIETCHTLVFSSRPDPMSTNVEGIVNCAAYSDGRRIATIPIADISEHLSDPNGFVWIGLYEPSEEMLKQIQEEFNLHDLAVEDAHRAHQRPKIETYGDTLFIVVRTGQINESTHNIDFRRHSFFRRQELHPFIRHGSSRPYSTCEGTLLKRATTPSQGSGLCLYCCDWMDRLTVTFRS
jgi:hypothetical protein